MIEKELTPWENVEFIRVTDLIYAPGLSSLAIESIIHRSKLPDWKKKQLMNYHYVDSEDPLTSTRQKEFKTVKKGRSYW